MASLHGGDAATRQRATLEVPRIPRRGSLAIVQPTRYPLSQPCARLLQRGRKRDCLPHCDEHVRKAVRKAERNGLTVEFSATESALREFFELFCRTRRKHGAPPQPYRFFTCIRKHVLEPGRGWIVLARQGKRPVAAAIYFMPAETHSTNSEPGRTIPTSAGNNLVMWSAIRRYASEGFTTFDFGRTSWATRGFGNLKRVGAPRSPLDYWRLDLKTGNFVTVADRASGSQAAVFRVLPAPLSRLIGSCLAYRHIG